MLKSMLRLVRIKNLVIVAATLYAMRFCIMQPLLAKKGMYLQLNEFFFLLLTLSTVFITAAGYVINDYFDTKTDTVNRPSTVVVGKNISRRQTITLHWILNALGVILGSIVSFYIQKPHLTLIFIVIPGVLWFYSTSYKRQFLTGNIIVAALTSAVPLMALLFEMPKLYSTYWQVMIMAPSVLNDLIYWVGGYATFAFLLTLFREIVKDIQDIEGDKEFGCNTLPIALGISAAKNAAAAILLSTLLALAYLFGAYLNFLPSGRFDYFTFFYMIFAFALPMFVLMVKTLSAESKEDYHWLSRFAKLVMLIGILYSVPFRFLVGF